MNNIRDVGVIRWTIKDILFILLLTFLLSYFLFLILEFIIEVIDAEVVTTEIKELIISFIQAVLLGGLPVLVWKIKYKLSLKEVGFTWSNTSIILNYGIIGGIFICLAIIIFNNFLYNIVDSTLGLTAPTQSVIKDLLNSPNYNFFISHSLLIVIVAPITEEIFFRGFIYPYFKKKFGKVKGIILNGIIFGLAHSSFWLFFATCLGGSILALIYERTESIYSCILAHSVWNMIIVFLIYILWHINLI